MDEKEQIADALRQLLEIAREMLEAMKRLEERADKYLN